jgi:eukaryotic-like serine/threonine-protein kinase
VSDIVTRLDDALSDRYVIEREIGQGGMATVFLAQDLKHNRPVALKVLKPELSAVVGAERFLTEIQTTANLQHPHILPLFDSGEADGLLFYVMPFVEGETLRERIERERQLPVEECIAIATAVANALDYAHRHGVVHRDVKPANILLQDGQPVVADFGIAIAVGAASGSRLTETGLSVGTPFYMSPEQATGDQAVGAASDIYALAAVLFEILVGEPPYLGTTAQAVLGKILQGQPVSATAVRKSIPVNVDAAIRKALERLPADRFASAHDFAKALGDPAFRHGEGADGGQGSSTPARRLQRWAGWAVAAVLAGLFTWSSTRPEPVPQALRLGVVAADGSAFARPAALLPDASGMVYHAPTPGGGAALWIRRWNEAGSTRIAGTDGAVAFGHSISPDGSMVAFTLDLPGKLLVAPLVGGAVSTLAEQSFIGSLWSPDGSSLYYTTGLGGIERVSTDGVGEPVTIVPGQLPDGGAIALTFVPGRNVVLVRLFAYPNTEISTINALDLETGEMKVIVEGTSPAFVTTEGVLVYGTADGFILAAPFDSERLEITGLASVIESGIAGDQFLNLSFSLAADGSVIFLPGLALSVGSPVWVGRAGGQSVIDADWIVAADAVNSSLALSPDGSRLAVSSRAEGPGWDLLVKQLPDGPLTTLPTRGPIDRRPAWSADGSTIEYISAGVGLHSELWSVPADGSQLPTKVLDLQASVLEGFTEPSGEWTIFRVGTNVAGQTDNDLLAIRPEIDSVPVTIVDNDTWARMPTLSPNGRWLAYTSDDSGQYEVFVRPFPVTGTWREQVSVDGGNEPVWSRDGSELFYKSALDLVAVSVRGEARLEVVSRTRLFPIAPFLRGSGHQQYDVHPDGNRFVMILTGASMARSTLYVQNWAQDVAARLGN